MPDPGSVEVTQLLHQWTLGDLEESSPNISEITSGQPLPEEWLDAQINAAAQTETITAVEAMPEPAPPVAQPVVVEPAVAPARPLFKANFSLGDLHEALEELESFDEQKARVVELRFFGGLSLEEVSEVLGISTATIKREWNVARAWLARRLDAREP